MFSTWVKKCRQSLPGCGSKKSLLGKETQLQFIPRDVYRRNLKVSVCHTHHSNYPVGVLTNAKTNSQKQLGRLKILAPEAKKMPQEIGK